MPSYSVCPDHGPYDLYAHEDGCPQCIEEWESGRYEHEAASDPDERDWLNPANHPELGYGIPQPQCEGVWGFCLIHEQPIWMCD